MSRSSGSSSTTTRATTSGGGGGGGSSSSKKLKGVRRRKWGKWVSEIRVPGTQERLWLGTYATPEAAAVAHDVAVYCLRKPPSLEKLNFPETLSSYTVFHQQQNRDLSPRSVQKVASDVAMDVDARNIANAGRMQSIGEYEKDNKVIGDEYDDDRGYVEVGAVGEDCGVSWWDGFQDDSRNSQGSEGENLSISVEDYL